MLYRRQTLLSGLALCAGASSARAQTVGPAVERAIGFMRQTSERLTAIVNGAGGPADKRAALQQILDVAVDVDGIARFCLGRFWRQASPDQQQRYAKAFHAVLVSNISTKLGEYKGVKVTVRGGRQQEDDVIVSSIVERPNNPPTNVDWMVQQPGSAPRIADVVAEGTSLRLTQRQDYAAYLSSHNNDIDALIAAMLQQTAQGR